MAGAEICSHDEHLLPAHLRRDYGLTVDLELRSERPRLKRRQALDDDDRRCLASKQVNIAQSLARISSIAFRPKQRRSSQAVGVPKSRTPEDRLRSAVAGCTKLTRMQS